MGDPDPESRRVQLAELNNRSRAYSAQLWQLPLAYLGAAGLVLSGLESSARPLGFVFSGVVGLLVFWHLLGMEDGRSRAVRHLQRLEDELNLARTAEDKPHYTRPMNYLVLISALASIVIGVCLWIR
jgi:hypothetical protein